MATKKTTKKTGTKSSGKATSATLAKQPVKKKLTAAERKARAAGTGKKAKAAPKEKPAKPKKLSLIDAAAQVLGESKEPMNCKQMVEQVTAKKLWSTNAATPHATLYTAWTMLGNRAA